MQVCPSCQLDNEDDAIVCYSCGQSLKPGRQGDNLIPGGILQPLPDPQLEPLVQEEEDWAEAIANYDEAIRLDPDDAEAYFNRGVAYDNLGQIDLAIQDYSKAIDLDPEDSDAYFQRGLAYSELEQHQNAIQDYQEVIRIEPEDGDAYFNRGLAYFSLGDYQRAFDDYNEAIRFDPEDAEIYAHGALTATLLGWDEEAEEYADRAVELGIAPTFLHVVVEELKKRRQPSTGP